MTPAHPPCRKASRIRAANRFPARIASGGRRAVLACAAGLLALVGQAAWGADYLALSFGAYRSSPVLLTHFSVEAPLAPTPELVVSGAAEAEMPRTAGSSAVGLPRDAGRDGRWTVAAQWIELQTSRAYRAELTVPVSALTEVYGAYELNVIFGPNGLMILGSDRVGNSKADRVDLVAGCGDRAPRSDRDWGRETARFPEVAQLHRSMAPVPARTVCPATGG
ncbi:hypothetical protein [Paracoccus sp. S1E-3]|uniref:hypothetical protein n=1 Tax=Paracoccus sp. S1E-3 TaxID=2756130 RepID=UPI0015EF2EE6|nr:hypothetical protein [Paracoccus sp. S1E-3]MBA4490650.1 hypothetical protein [Paracoccus sp. S1E-3]